MSCKGITDLLQLVLNGERLVKDDKDRLFDQFTSDWISDGLFDGCKADITVSASGTENHTFKSLTFFVGNNTSDRRETHVHVTCTFFLQQSFRLVSGSIGGRRSCGKFGNGQTRSISHEETTSLLQDFLQFHLFIVFHGQLLGKRVEFLQLILIVFQFHLKCFQQILVILSLQEGIDITYLFQFHIKTITFI